MIRLVCTRQLGKGGLRVEFRFPLFKGARGIGSFDTKERSFQTLKSLDLTDDRNTILNFAHQNHISHIDE
jgi:hypothetical protein